MKCPISSVNVDISVACTRTMAPETGFCSSRTIPSIVSVMGLVSMATDLQQHLLNDNRNIRRGRNFTELIWSDRTVTGQKERDPHAISWDIESPLYSGNQQPDKPAAQA